MTIQVVKTLIKRELWENKTSLFVTPLIIAILIIVMAMGASLYSSGVVDPTGIHIVVQTDDLLKNENLKNYNLIKSVSGDPKAFDGFVMGSMYSNCVLLFLLFSTVLLAYVTRSMFDDRKNRDILFWRSMPVSETANVLVKVGMVVLAVPLIITALNIAVTIIMALFGLLVFPLLGAKFSVLFSSLFNGVAWYIPLQIGFELLFGMLMLLPLIGFIMLASAYAKKSPFLIVMSPALFVLIDVLLQKIVGFSIGVTYILMGYWNMLVAAKSAFILYEPLVVTLPLMGNLLACITIGAGLLVATIWLRNNRYEI